MSITDKDMYGNRKFSIWRLLFSIVKFVIIALLIFFALVIIIQRISNNQNSFLGYRVFRVETGSMIPKYAVGDVILVKEKDVNKIDVGDDLVYVANYGQVNGRIITHQVVRIDDDGEKRTFHTKGIANSSEDPLVSESQIKGTVVHKIYLISILFNLLYDRYLSYFIIIIPLTIYIAFSLFHRATRKKEQYMEKHNKNNDDDE